MTVLLQQAFTVLLDKHDELAIGSPLIRQRLARHRTSVVLKSLGEDLMSLLKMLSE